MANIVEKSTWSGKDLRKIRKGFNFTLRDFAKKVGIAYQNINSYEKGKRTISLQTENQIKKALGLCLDKKHDYELHVHLDYLRLTFFDTTPEIIMRHVLSIEKEYFVYEENKRHGFDGIYSCGRIQLYVSEKPEQGTMLELSGQGLLEMESILKEKSAFLLYHEIFTLNEWLITITNPDYYLKHGLFTRYNCSRLDIAIDEMFKETGNYDLHDIKFKKDYADGVLIGTKLRSSRDIESYWQDKPLGLTLYFGSSNGNFLLRMYEKAKERAQKENRDLEDVLLDYGVVNRYEMQVREEYAEEAFNQLSYGHTLDQFAIDLLLSKISVFEEVVNESGNISYAYCKNFYDVFGNFKHIKINGKTNETDIERSMKWIVLQVSGTLAMLQEIFGKQWLFDWLNKIMDEIIFSEKQQKIINSEKARVSSGENASFLFYDKDIREGKLLPQKIKEEVVVSDIEDTRSWIIRVKQLPSKVLYYVDSSGNYTTIEPDPMTLEEINILGNEKGVDFLNSPLFVVYKEREYRYSENI